MTLCDRCKSKIYLVFGRPTWRQVSGNERVGLYYLCNECHKLWDRIFEEKVHHKPDFEKTWDKEFLKFMRKEEPFVFR